MARWVHTAGWLIGGGLLAPLLFAADFDDQSFDARRAAIERMTPEQKAELIGKQQRFADLTPDERSKLRRLHDELQQVPDPVRTELKTVMHNYYQWSKKLPAGTRMELAELPPKERVERIKQLIAADVQAAIKGLSAEDQAAIRNWMEALSKRMWERRPEPPGGAAERERPPNGNERERPDAAVPSPHRRMMWAWRRWADMPGKPIFLEDGDLSELKAKLSAKARQQLERLPEPEQWRRVGRWVQGIIRAQMSPGGPGSRFNVDDAELAKFFEKELTPEQRDHLMNLPPDRMQSELLGLYWQSRFRNPGNRPPGGRGPDRPGRWPDGPPPPGEQWRPSPPPRGPQGGPFSPPGSPADVPPAKPRADEKPKNDAP